ncbi:hypothetical protein FN846DRAFT_967588 [Sphaerosporella brunnea]|uniref:Uncharacterized protein n=1 Tax=Sphaerosporella brunnea TaxID=1250544 RepID=A0A5J5EMD0_9PEZI|nr:hypothetical protein FN846DRAFT_967588 [Sphaerosporella brunnea]
MSTNPRARISSIVTEPFDPLYGWHDDEDPQPQQHQPNVAPARPAPSTVNPAPPPPPQFPAFDPSYPFSPFALPAEAGMPPMPHYGSAAFFASPPHSPRLQPTVKSTPAPPPPPVPPGEPDLADPANVISPLSPPGAAWRGEREKERERDRDLTVSPLIGRDSFPAPPGREKDTSYLSAPKAMMDIEAADDKEGFSQERRSHRLSRSGSMAQRFGRMLGSVRRSRTSAPGARWNTVRRSRLGEDYTELEEVEERDEPIGFDVSSFGPEFAVPQPTQKVMEKHEFNEDMAYTGTGEAIDLSNLTGFEEGAFDRRDSDAFSLHRAGTMENANRQSFYFSPDRRIPNWKPPVLQTWYLLLLIATTIIMIISAEVLFQLSDRQILRKGPGREGGGLFAYVEIETLSTLQFAIWKYLPTIVGVLYGIAWKVTDEELKRSEPYYQLSKGCTGALAAESLNIEYHTVWSPMIPMAALKYKQFVVAAGSLTSFLASSAVPIFLSVMIRVDPSQKERQHMPDHGKEAIKRLVVDSLWTRLLETTLVVIIILATYIVFVLTRRRSGLLGDPSGIAGVAAMANQSHILMDFRDLDLANEKQIHKQLNKRTYILHKGALWQAQVLKESERDHSAPKAMNPHPLLLRVKGMVPFIVFNCAILVLLPTIVYNQVANVIIDKTPWIITGISILIKTIWELLEKELRMLEPFWMLWLRNADSSVLTLDYSATIPGWIVFKALGNRHWLLAWVTTVTLFIEVLTVVLGSLDAQGGEESPLSSRMSFGLAIAIVCIIVVTSYFVLHLRRHTFLPRQPGTISSVLAFIHQSKMLTDFSGTELMSTKQRKKRLEEIGNKYGFGWYLGRDGNRHLGIDQEPLLERYTFGNDPRKAVVDGNLGSWERWDGRE